jgi:hypothetical protein
MSGAIETPSLAAELKSKMKICQGAGKPAAKEMLGDLVRLEHEYFVRVPT